MNEAAPPVPVAATKATPAYEQIAQALRRAVIDGRLPAGAMLFENAVAASLGVSRSPARAALLLLEREGLIRPLDKRGYAVGQGGVGHRIDLTTVLGNLSRPRGWELIFDQVERALIHCSVMGRFRVNENEMARSFDVGRTVAHDVLLRLESAGIVQRDENAQWQTVSLDVKRINDLYDLRVLVEPYAVALTAAHVPAAQLIAMRDRLHAAMRVYPAISAQDLGRLDRELHVDLLERAPNPELLPALRRTQCLLISGKHILGWMQEADPFLEDHDEILERLLAGKTNEAREALVAHLNRSRDKVTSRLNSFRAGYQLTELSYVT